MSDLANRIALAARGVFEAQRLYVRGESEYLAVCTARVQLLKSYGGSQELVELVIRAASNGQDFPASEVRRRSFRLVG